MQTLSLTQADNPLNRPEPVLLTQGVLRVVRFQAMASPCEVLFAGLDDEQVGVLGRLAARETWRIERALSRYLPDNPIARIHAGRGQRIAIDPELFRLLSYADQCYQMSGGRFDVTSGVLRHAWRFDGSDRLPEQALINSLLTRVGWLRVQYGEDWILLPDGMELDLGGIGKEYAVDRVLLLLLHQLPQWGKTLAEGQFGVLVNFGGDLVCSGPPPDGQAWHVGIEDARRGEVAIQTLSHRHGGLATSGDARRYLVRDGKRYGHILDPRTGWPVEQAPRSVTVAAATCTLAGMMATFAMLHGAEAEVFLQAQKNIQYWIQR